MRRFRHIVLAATLVLPLGFISAGEQDDPESQPRSEPSADEAGETDRLEGEEEVLRFTNEDLKSVRPQDRHEGQDPAKGTGDEGEESADGESGADLEVAMEELSQEALKRSMDETRREIAELGFHLEYLNKRLLSVQNPILRGVTPSSRDEEEAVGGLSNVDRLDWVKDQIAVTEDALAEAQEYMSTLIRR